ncbi:MAG: hypothetical protein H6733_05050 [Alphaproteobacteria bacterium]|nr:hypothetical protein [Alphaproteobacteria bacterium]
MPGNSEAYRSMFAPIVDALIQASREPDTASLDDLSAAIEVLSLVAEGLASGSSTPTVAAVTSTYSGPQFGDDVWIIKDTAGDPLAVLQGPNGTLPELIASCVPLPFDGTENSLTFTVSTETAKTTQGAFITYACSVLKPSARYTGTMYGYSVGGTTALGTTSC